MKYDVLIIGAGLGGLLCGYMLCKHGMSVAVLEKNHVLGGCLQSFRRDGYVFDTGMHYIGSMEKGQLLNKFWHYFGLTDTVALKRLDTDAFDIISYGGKRYASRMGYENFVDGLSADFPNERENLNRYVELLQKVATSSPVSRLEESEVLQPLNMEYVRRSASSYIEEITSNPILQNVLAGNSPLYGGVRGKTPFYIHAFIHNSYIQGAYRIVGGSQTIADSLAQSIRAMGGEVRSDCEVVSLKGTETVECCLLKTGERVEGNYFISDVHPKRMVALLDENLIKRSYCRRIRQTPDSIGGITLYLGFKEHTVPYLNSNFFHYDVDDVWSCTDYTSTDWPRGYLFMHQPPTDGTLWSRTAVMISYMRYSDVVRWHGTPIEHRGADYDEFKTIHAQRMLKSLERAFPGLRQKIAYCNVSTPLTYEDYTGTYEGSMYGLLRDVTSPVQTVVSQQTYLSNLLMTGQNTNSHGMLGVTNGAMLTCSHLLGLNTLIRDINRSNA